MRLNNIGKKITKLKNKKQKILIEFDDNSTLEVNFEVYEKYNFQIGDVISKKQYECLKNDIELNKYKKYLLNLVSKHSYSSKEIEDKLIKKGLDKKNISILIKYLKSYSFLDDEAYINNYITYANKKRYSYEFTKSKLIEKGFTKKDIFKLKYSYKNEYEKAKKVMLSKHSLYASYSYNHQKEKGYIFLVNKGFDKDVINKVIEECFKYDYEVELKKLKKDYSIIRMKYCYKYLGKLLDEKVIQYLLRKGYPFKDIKLVEEEYSYETSE